MGNGAVSLLVVLLAGCEEDVAAVLGTGRAFTLYGVFTSQMDTQWVRVYAIENQRLTPTRPEPLDARFTTTDLAIGEARVWNDSLIQEPTGQWAHVFWAPFQNDCAQYSQSGLCYGARYV